MEENRNQQSDFVKETIKQRPLNRKKLLRRTLITALMAVVFGTIACLTFLLLEPVISNSLYPEEEPEPVVFVEEPEDEILPEDMIVDESQMNQPEPTEAPALVDKQIEQVLSEVKLGVDDYNSLYKGLADVAKGVQNSMVTVVGVTSDVDWFNNAYVNEGTISGVIIADNGRELLVLVAMNLMEEAETLKVTFADGSECEAAIKKKDNNTGLAVLAVKKTEIDKETLQIAVPIALGSSAGSSLVGTPIIAIGQPLGVTGSLCYGFVTSAGSVIHLPDSSYKLVTTDIYGSKNATGILINIKGQMVGMIDPSRQHEDIKNLISAIGITELKKMIQSLSNDEEIPYLGIYGSDVSVEARQELGVPVGVYITEIDMDSPAMEAGIQSGDIIHYLDDQEIGSYAEFINYLIDKDPEQTVTIGFFRQGPEGYTEMQLDVVLKQK